MSEHSPHSAEDIGFARWFTAPEGYSTRCERFGDECGIEDGVQYRQARKWLRAAFQAGFDAAHRMAMGTQHD